MIDLLADNPTLLLFSVAGIGVLLGSLRVRGFGLGVAAVLFTGIAMGALDPRLRLPEPVWVLGLAVFVYTVGLEAGPGFVNAIRRRGLSTNLLVLGAFGAGAAATLGAAAALSVDRPEASGGFAGGLTNTPALAAVTGYLRNHLSPDAFERLGADPVVGYSLAYPVGVLVPLAAVFWLLRSERRARRTAPAVPAQSLVCVTVEVRVDVGRTLGELRSESDQAVTFSRLRRDGTVSLATSDVTPAPGDLVTVIGSPTDVEPVIDRLGRRSDVHLSLDRADYDSRRMFVSSRLVAGKRLGELDLPGRVGATVTRVRRGDVDLLADEATTLELGDRVRVVAPRQNLRAAAELFGDSYRAIGEIDVMTFSVGIALGLLLGAVEVPLPGGQEFSLGNAGGPLLVGLLLGALGRTGPLVWQTPHSANATLRQLGTVLFLAGVGTNSGQAFWSTVQGGDAWPLVALGAAVTAAACATTLVVGLRLLHIPPRTLAGVLAGMQTQPAVYAFATEQVEIDTEVATGYATVYPVAMIAKIVAAQLLIAGVTG